MRHTTEARCSCVDGVWTDTDLSETQRLADEATERARVDLLRRSWSRRKYEYVGDGAEAEATTPPGRQIMRRRDLDEFLSERIDEVEELFTYVVVDGALRVAPRRSEHVACAGHGPVEAAGEISFEKDDHGRWRVSEVSNQSAGYCPESSCFDAVEDALSLPGIDHPGGFTSAFEFRRCPGCGERNLVKDEYYVCGACDVPLPETWNLDADDPSIDDGGGPSISADS